MRQWSIIAVNENSVFMLTDSNDSNAQPSLFYTLGRFDLVSTHQDITNVIIIGAGCGVLIAWMINKYVSLKGNMVTQEETSDLSLTQILKAPFS